MDNIPIYNANGLKAIVGSAKNGSFTPSDTYTVQDVIGSGNAWQDFGLQTFLQTGKITAEMREVLASVPFVLSSKINEIIAFLKNGDATQFIGSDGTNPVWKDLQISDIINLQTLLNDKANIIDVYTKTQSDTNYYTKTQSDTNYEPKNVNIQTHISSVANPHNVTKAQVGLGNVDNTSDVNKPISTATQTELTSLQTAITLSGSFNIIQPAVTVTPTAAIPIITAPENDGGSFVAGLNILQYLNPVNEVQNKNSGIIFRDTSNVLLGNWLKTGVPVTNNKILFPSNTNSFNVIDVNEPVNYTIVVTLKLTSPNNNRQKITLRVRRAVANGSGLFLFGTSINSFFTQQAETDGTIVIQATIKTFVKGEADPFVTGGLIIDLSLKEGTSQLSEVTTVRIYRK